MIWAFAEVVTLDVVGLIGKAHLLGIFRLVHQESIEKAHMDEVALKDFWLEGRKPILVPATHIFDVPVTRLEIYLYAAGVV
jgi:hypothetical protein